MGLLYKTASSPSAAMDLLSAEHLSPTCEFHAETAYELVLGNLRERKGQRPWRLRVLKDYGGTSDSVGRWQGCSAEDTYQ